MRELAVEFKAARETIAKQLRLFEIPIRNAGSNQNRKRGLAYGKKIKDREIVNYKKEQEVIDKIRELRDQGFSYHKIPDILNVMKVPTKTRKGKWSSKTVWQVINNTKKA